MQPNNQPTSQGPMGYQAPPSSNKKLMLGLAAGALLILAILLGVVLLGGKKMATPSPTPAKPAVAILPAGSVVITAAGFTPTTIKVKKGQSVQWTNQDTKPHQVASDPFPSEDALPGFKADEAQAKGDTYSFTFDKVGSFTYHDHLDPLKLKGTVVVE